jgi:hypothetical protein
MNNLPEIKQKTLDIYQIILDKTRHMTSIEVNKEEIRKISNDIYETYFKAEHLNFVVDMSGHNKGRYDNRTLQDIMENEEYETISERLFDGFKFSILLCVESCIKFVNQLKDCKQSEEHLIHNLNYTLYEPFEGPSVNCFQCGKTSRLQVNGNKFNLITDRPYLSKLKGQQPCEYPNGLGAYSYFLDIPSGKFVIGNKLIQLLPDEILEAGLHERYLLEKIGDYTLNDSGFSRKLSHEYWNEHKIAYITMGNSNPSAFLTKDTQQVIIKSENRFVSDGSDDDIEDDCDNYTDNEVLKGRIDTDLWAVCAMDYDYFVELSKNEKKDPAKMLKKMNAFIIEVPAGQYEIEYLGELRKFAHEPHAVFKKVE